MTAVGAMCVFFLLLIGGAAVWIGKLGERIRELEDHVEKLEKSNKHRREYAEYLQGIVNKYEVKNEEV